MFLHCFEILYYLGVGLLVSHLSQTKGFRGVSPYVGSTLDYRPGFVWQVFSMCCIVGARAVTQKGETTT